MLAVAGVLGAAILALFVYLRHERLGIEGVALATLRTIGLAALILLVVNPGWARPGQRGAPVVLLDASLSMGSNAGQWQAAVDTASTLAGSRGTVLAFGRSVRTFQQDAPSDGVSRLNPALQVAQGLGRPIAVVTDGELTDAEVLATRRAGTVGWVLVPRDTAASAALLSVDLPPLINRGDSLTVVMTVGVFGNLESDSATLEVTAGKQLLLTRRITLPQSGTGVRRSVTVPSRNLRLGPNVLELRLTAAGDEEPRDDLRHRIVTATDQPAVIVIADPADWEGRFLSESFSQVSGSPVRGFARITDGGWIEMRSLARVSEAAVARAARNAGLLIVRGAVSPAARFDPQGPWWWWPVGGHDEPAAVSGDWYVDRDVGSSPLAPALSRIAWDSLSPLTAVARIPLDSADWVALTARLGRQGAPRPALVGESHESGRRLITAATGFWRWALRGDLGAEAFRTVTAAGMDWLLRADGARRREVTLASNGVAARDTPLIFEFTGAVPDSAVVLVRSDSGTARHVLHPDPSGRAELWMEPGIYDWSVEGTRSNGVAVVEPYSAEFTPGSVMLSVETGSVAGFADIQLVRQRWWMFLLALVALVAEWAWRQRRGLP